MYKTISDIVRLIEKEKGYPINYFNEVEQTIIKLNTEEHRPLDEIYEELNREVPLQKYSKIYLMRQRLLNQI